MMIRKQPPISVIIPTYNSWATLKPCIVSIYNQSLKPSEIIVVDNASSDGTSFKIKKTFPGIKLITLKKNTGVTGGRNTGIINANKKSDYLFFFDHDMVADKNMMTELVKVAKGKFEIGIVTPKIYFWGSKKRIWSAGTGINLWNGRTLFRGGEDHGQFEKAEEVQVAPAAILVKKEVIEKIKFFDGRYFVTYEDTDFCFRARRGGFKTFYAPKALAYHKISWDPKSDAIRVLSRGYWVGRNRIIFMKDFGNNFYIFLLFVPIFIIFYLRLTLLYGRFADWVKFIHGTFVGIAMGVLWRKALFSGERPPLADIDGVHMAKYEFAAKFCKGKEILELGCGWGYGSKYLAENSAGRISAYDIAPSAISFAMKNSYHSNISFLEADVEELRLKEKYDVILAFELIEHLKNPNKLLEIAKNNLKKEGIFILSTPNRAYTPYDGDKPSNPYHVHEYYPDELKRIVKEYFNTVNLYGVVLTNKELMKREIAMRNSFRWRLANYFNKKRIIRRILNFLPNLPKRLATGETKLSFKTGDFKVLRNRADESTDFVAVCKP